MTLRSDVQQLHEDEVTEKSGITLWRIEGPDFTAGLMVKNGIVDGAAPILKKYIGLPWTEVRRILKDRDCHGKIITK